MNSDLGIETQVGKHPFFQKERILFHTSPIKRLYSVVRRSILVSSESVWLEGPSGAGKSPTARLIVEWLQRDIGDTLVVYFAVPRTDERNVHSFPYRLALASGVDQPSSRPERLAMQMFACCVNCALSSPFRKVAFVLDECQALRSSDYEHLKDIANALERKGCALVTVMFGESPRFGRRIQELRQGDETGGLAKRFAKRKASLPLYESLEDVHSLCEAIDTQSIAELDGQSVTQNLLPKAWEDGFRLANHAASLWTALHSAPSTAALVFGSVRCASLLMLENDAPGFTPKPSLFTKAVRQSGGPK